MLTGDGWEPSHSPGCEKEQAGFYESLAYFVVIQRSIWSTPISLMGRPANGLIFSYNLFANAVLGQLSPADRIAQGAQACRRTDGRWVLADSQLRWNCTVQAVRNWERCWGVPDGISLGEL